MLIGESYQNIWNSKYPCTVVVPTHPLLLQKQIHSDAVCASHIIYLSHIKKQVSLRYCINVWNSSVVATLQGKALWYACNYSDCVLSCERCWSTVDLDRRIVPECIVCRCWARADTALLLSLNNLISWWWRVTNPSHSNANHVWKHFSDSSKDLRMLKQSVLLVRQTFCLFPDLGSTSDQLWRETLLPTCVEWTAWHLSDLQVNKSPFCWLTFEIAACLAPHSGLLLIIYKSQQYGSEVLMRWHPLLWPPSSRQQRQASVKVLKSVPSANTCHQLSCQRGSSHWFNVAVKWTQFFFFSPGV